MIVNPSRPTIPASTVYSRPPVNFRTIRASYVESPIFGSLVDTVRAFVRPNAYTISGAKQSTIVAEAILRQLDLPVVATDFLLFGEIIVVVNWESKIPGVVAIPPDDVDNVEQAENYPVRPARLEISSQGVVFDLTKTPPDAIVAYFNRTLKDVRGFSPLSRVIPVTQAAEDAVMGAISNPPPTYVWDVELLGASPELVQSYVKSNPPPESGGVIGHNESVRWSLIKGEVDLPAHFKATRELSTLGPSIIGLDLTPNLPKAIAAMGESVNPTLALLRDYQDRWFGGLESIVNRILIETKNEPVKIVGPRITTRDFQRVSAAFLRVTQAILKAYEQGVVTKTEARELVTDMTERVKLR